MPLVHSPILATPDSPKKKNIAIDKKTAKGGGGYYAANIAYMDKLVGKLVDELDRLGIRENTLIVFTGDNGSVPIGTINGRPIDGKKGDLLEGGSRVPLIASWPGTTPKGVIIDDLIDFSDMLPTFADLAGARLPSERKIDGRSFAPQLKGAKGQPRDWVYIQLGEKRYVRSDRWKLNNDGEFFDMKDAPFRQLLIPGDTNDAAARAARMQLQSVLDGLKAEGSAPSKKRKKKIESAAGLHFFSAGPQATRIAACAGCVSTCHTPLHAERFQT
jgi:arylsulfatase A